MTFQFKMTLKDTDSPVWRRVLVDESITFAGLHEIIQIAFEWEDNHLHRFETQDENGDQLFTQPMIAGIEPSIYTEIDEEEVILEQFFQKPKDSLRYLYDFGEEWDHEIVFEKRVDAQNIEFLPYCIELKGEAPEEDGYIFDEEPMTDEELQEMINYDFIFELVGGDLEGDEDILGLMEPSRASATDHVDIETWKELFSWVDNIKKMKPWEYMHDGQIFAIWASSINDYLYCSVMGNSGMHYGITCYIGGQGLTSLVDTIANQGDFDDLDVMLHYRALTVHLLDRNELETEEYELTKEIGRSYRGEKQLPAFHSMKPLHYTWSPDQEEAELLLEVFPELINVLKRAKKQHDLIPINLVQWFARTLTDDGNWQDTIINPMERYEKAQEVSPVDLEISELELARIKKEFKKENKEIELGVIPIPEPFQDSPGQRPFYPFMFIALDIKSGQAIHHNLLQLHEGTRVLQDGLVQLINQIQVIPSVLYMDNEERAYELQPVTDKLSIHIEIVEELEVVSTFLDDMIETLSSGNIEDILPF